MLEVLPALQRGDVSEGRTEIGPELLARPFRRAAREGFELGKYLLNGIEIRAVRGEKAQGRPGLLNLLGTNGIFMHGEVVQDNHIAWAEGGD